MHNQYEQYLYNKVGVFWAPIIYYLNIQKKWPNVNDIFYKDAAKAEIELIQLDKTTADQMWKTSEYKHTATDIGQIPPNRFLSFRTMRHSRHKSPRAFLPPPPLAVHYADANDTEIESNEGFLHEVEFAFGPGTELPPDLTAEQLIKFLEHGRTQPRPGVPGPILEIGDLDFSLNGFQCSRGQSCGSSSERSCRERGKN
jgi:hypothetical protein